ncbi:hypothetical protein BTA51_10235 [Hahella sp. CCB-MM4]|uniref:YbgA family protein n=1 Tax=Hahella sp. (strain CCB-MM4) TaxID=1926491 RepID=UPI000B9AA272|nr:DUF523 and DUF1722 domain-containing protein [Hahella sp. CCB-MM4]OZG73397.1 hypothetical protein BTA51_10235 [Hahella sp. CCB-MM4]
MNENCRNHRPLVAISACLRGENVRFDGGHKNSLYIREQLGRFMDFKAICPEVGIGLGVPRQALRLVATDSGVAAVGSRDSKIDVTNRLRQFAEERIPDLTQVDGYIFMQKSPSCGAFRVKVYNEEGNQIVASRPGIYAGYIQAALPTLPIEEAGRLSDPVLLENFVTRVFCHNDWRTNVQNSSSISALMSFHARHKSLLKACSPSSLPLLGNIVANTRQNTLHEDMQRYKELFMSALAKKAERKNHAHVLQDLVRTSVSSMSDAQLREWESLLYQYRQGTVPLIVPLTLLNHYLLAQNRGYATGQTYLKPHPHELGLRNQI